MWNLAENNPEYLVHVLLLFMIEYNLEGKCYRTKYIIEGYYHTDNVYCDFSGETMENIIAWMNLPNKDLIT